MHHSLPAFACAVLLAICATCPGTTLALTSEAEQVRPVVDSAWQHLPMAFEENRGQLDPAVLFLSRGEGHHLFLTRQEAVMVLASRSVGEKPILSSAQDAAVVRLAFMDANDAPKVRGVDQLEHKTNYFMDADPKRKFTDIQNFARVKYADLYPGVDLIYYGNQGRLEYDLIVAPHTGIHQIKLRIQGSTKQSLSADGDLILSTALGELSFRKPVAYQDLNGARISVPARYVLLQDQLIGFAVGEYDQTKPLVIDPILSYSSFLWGSDVKGVKVDAGGNAYVIGNISTAELPAAGTLQTRLLGNQDAYVAKLDASGTRLVYATYLGARRATTFANALAIDSSNNVYVAGTTTSSSFPVTSGAYQTSYAAGASYLTKLNASGNQLLYSTFVNGATISALAVDADGNAYMTGNANVITTTAGALQPQRPSSMYQSPFVARLNASGNMMIYATYLGGSGQDTGKSIAVDASGHAYVTGSARSADFPLRNPVQAQFGGTEDAFISKINPQGTELVFSTFLGGSAADYGNGIAIDAAGQAHVAGWTNSDDLPVTAGSFQTRKGYPGPDISNAFIAKLNATGSALVYSSYLGGAWCRYGGTSACSGFLNTERVDGATAVAVDAAGYAYVGGYAMSFSFPLVDAIQPVSTYSNVWRTPFAAKVRPGGDRLVYSVVLGASSQDARVNGMAVDDAGSAYVVGYNAFAFSNYPLTPDAVKTTGGAFIFKLATGKYPTTLQSSSNPASTSQTVNFSAQVLSVTPGGQVTFMDGDTLLGIAAVEQGVASISARLVPGVHRISAIYSEDDITSPPVYQVITAD